MRYEMPASRRAGAAALIAAGLALACSNDFAAGPAAGRAAAPKQASVVAASDCENSSVAFRKVVGSCFIARGMCGYVLAVDFDDAGVAREAHFLTPVASEKAVAAGDVVACVTRKMSALVNRCTDLKSRSFRQTCTPH